MTDINELVAVALSSPVGDEVCEFDCDSNKCTAENELGRVGTKKYKQNMAKGKSTCQWKASGKDFQSAEHITAEKPMPMQNDWGWSVHHLIPLKSFKDSRIKKLIEASEGEVRCQAGYGINGVENGAWLIYFSEMIKSLKEKGGIGDAVADSMQQAGVSGSGSLYTQLSRSGQTPEDPMEFRAYIYEVMRVEGCQFHNAHGGYIESVKNALEKLYEELDKDKTFCIETDRCKKSKSQKPAAPHLIVLRLNAISRRLETKLTGEPSTWHEPWFVSEFARMLAKDESGK